MPNQYVNKVELANGNAIIDISDTTAVASDVAQGKYFYLASGEKISGTASGGGASLGGLANMVDVDTQNYQLAYMLMCMKKGQTVGGTIKYTSAFSNSEQKILETGLTTLHGILFVGIDEDIKANTGHTQCCKWVLITINSSGTYNLFGTMSSDTSSQTRKQVINLAQSTADNSFPISGSLRFDGGNIYYTARYNKNANYQFIAPNEEYEWLAW